MRRLTEHDLDPAEWAPYVRQMLDYNAETGAFIWKGLVGRRAWLNGKVAGTLAKDGYRKITLRNKQLCAHRLVFLWLYGEWPKGYIDHTNHKRDDNRRSKLRDTTQTENICNQSKPRPNALGFMGVQKNYDKYQAKLWHERKFYHLGMFDTAEEAARAYDEAVRRIRSPHAKTSADYGAYDKGENR